MCNLLFALGFGVMHPVLESRDNGHGGCALPLKKRPLGWRGELAVAVVVTKELASKLAWKAPSWKRRSSSTVTIVAASVVVAAATTAAGAAAEYSVLCGGGRRCLWPR